MTARYGQDIWIRKIHGGPYQRAGIPDLIGCLHGLFFAFEVKMPGEVATPLQLHTLREITRAAATARVISSVEEAERVLDLLQERDKVEGHSHLTI